VPRRELTFFRYRSSSITGRQYETSIAHRGVENCVPSFGDVPGGIFDGVHFVVMWHRGTTAGHRMISFHVHNEMVHDVR
jgi:hypothetical protein